jgi:quinol monooxygenase YgiN
VNHRMTRMAGIAGRWSTMIVVRITMNVLPEKQKELVQTLLSMVESMEKEAGCLSYALFCNMEDKNLLNLLEEWQTRKDLISIY